MRYVSESLWVALGAAIGANLRYWLSVATDAGNQRFPWPTMTINILGSMALGVFSAICLIKGWGGTTRLFFAVGLCGGFTTFSTFSFEVVDAIYERSWRLAIGYAISSVILCVCGCYVGAHVARYLFSKQHTVQQNPLRPEPNLESDDVPSHHEINPTGASN
jgi:CrcB protein